MIFLLKWFGYMKNKTELLNEDVIILIKEIDEKWYEIGRGICVSIEQNYLLEDEYIIDNPTEENMSKFCFFKGQKHMILKRVEI